MEREEEDTAKTTRGETCREGLQVVYVVYLSHSHEAKNCRIPTTLMTWTQTKQVLAPKAIG